MRYEILKPPSPRDPRKSLIASLAALHEIAPPVLEAESEAEVRRAVRDLMPDAVPMPMPLKIGSGQIWMLGFCEDSRRQFTAEDTIPFVLFVRAIPERERDRVRVLNNAHFDHKLWRVPIERADVRSSVMHRIQVRSGEMQAPIYTHAMVGRTDDGRLVLVFDVGGGAVSLSFDQKTLEMRVVPEGVPLGEVSEPVDTVNRDSVGASFDPSPVRD